MKYVISQYFTNEIVAFQFLEIRLSINSEFLYVCLVLSVCLSVYLIVCFVFCLSICLSLFVPCLSCCLSVMILYINVIFIY